MFTGPGDWDLESWGPLLESLPTYHVCWCTCWHILSPCRDNSLVQHRLLYLLLLLLSRFSRVQLCVTPETAATRLPRPWDSPGKNTGVGCHFLPQCMKVKSESEVTQSCLTLCNPMDGSHQAPPSLRFSRQEHWSELPFPSPMHESEKWNWSCSVMSDS